MCPDASMHIIAKISTFVKLAFINIQILGILILSDNFALQNFWTNFSCSFQFFCTMQVKPSHFESFIYSNFLVLLFNPASLHECCGTIVKLFLLLF